MSKILKNTLLMLALSFKATEEFKITVSFDKDNINIPLSFTRVSPNSLEAIKTHNIDLKELTEKLQDKVNKINFSNITTMLESDINNSNKLYLASKELEKTLFDKKFFQVETPSQASKENLILHTESCLRSYTYSILLTLINLKYLNLCSDFVFELTTGIIKSNS